MINNTNTATDRTPPTPSVPADPKSQFQGQAITFGSLAEVMKFILKLMDSSNEMQQRMCELAQQLSKFNKTVTAWAGKSTENALMDQSDAQRTAGWSKIAMGGAQFGMGATTLGYNRAIGKKIEPLNEHNDLLDSYRKPITAEKPDPKIGDVNGPYSKDAHTQIERLKMGDFSKSYSDPEVREANIKAAKEATAADRKEILKKIDQHTENNAHERNRLDGRRSRFNNLGQYANGAVQGITDGTSNALQANDTADQAKEEATKAVSQAVAQTLRPEEATQQMDKAQQNALEALKIKEALQQSANYRGH